MSLHGVSPRASARTSVDPLRISEKVLAGLRPGSRAASPAPLQALQVLPPSTCTSFPTYSGAIIQSAVQHGLNSLVQPRFDGLAERLSGMVSSAQRDLQELERCLERCDTRLDSRLTQVESRLAVLGDSTARSEQRERELNARIGAMAEGMLQAAPGTAPRVADSGSAAGLSAAQVAELERRMREVDGRAEGAEEGCRKMAKHCRRLEDHMGHVEEQSRSFARLQSQLQITLQDLPAGGCYAAADGQLVAQQVALLEEELQGLAGRLALCDRGGGHKSAATLESRLECHRADVDHALVRLAGKCQEAQAQANEAARKRDEQRDEARTVADRQEASASRLDDLNLRFAALKVKVDGMEGRRSPTAGKGGEAGAAGLKPTDSQLYQEVMDRCRQAIAQVEPRLEVIERQLTKLPDICEDAVEEALDRLQLQTRFGGVGAAVSEQSPLQRRASFAAASATPPLGRWELDGFASEDGGERRRSGKTSASGRDGTHRRRSSKTSGGLPGTPRNLRSGTPPRVGFGEDFSFPDMQSLSENWVRSRPTCL